MVIAYPKNIRGQKSGQLHIRIILTSSPLTHNFDPKYLSVLVYDFRYISYVLTTLSKS